MKKIIYAAIVTLLGITLSVFCGCSAKYEAVKNKDEVKVAGHTYAFSKAECEDGEVQDLYKRAYANVKIVFIDGSTGYFDLADTQNDETFTYEIVQHGESLECGVRLNTDAESLNGAGVSSEWTYSTAGNLFTSHEFGSTIVKIYFECL